MGLLVVLVITAICVAKGLASFGVGFTPLGQATIGRCEAYARRPFSIPAIPRSSSRSGQWMPIGMISKFARSFAEARWRRGYQSSGVAILRPSTARGELDRAGVEVADVNFQSNHSRPPVAARDVIEGGG